MPLKGQLATHCKRGHELTSANRAPKGPNERGGGRCKLCARDSGRRLKGSPLAGTFLPIDPKLIERQRLREDRKKRCPACGVIKGWESFTRDPSGSDGIHGWCRACRNRKRFGTPDARRRNRDAWRRQKYGLSREQHQSLLDSQDGVCAICRQPCGHYEELAVDHDHVTGVVRGLLCHGCNSGLGQFKDSVERLSSAIVYLEAGGWPQSQAALAG